MNHQEPDRTLDRIVSFLRQVGIPAVEAPLSSETFLPGVTISAGSILYHPGQLLWPGDLLHEAGHLAVTPAHQRPSLDAVLSERDTSPDAGEVEATAWAFAAVVAIGLDPAVLFHPGGYRGQSANLIFTYSCGCFPGAAGLQASGMALSVSEARSRGLRPYPQMLRWLRE